LFGYWIQAVATENFFALPLSIDRIEWFAPYPPDGTLVRSRIRILEMTERQVRADHELLLDGNLLVRITNWVDRRFDSDPVIHEAVRWPERSTLSTRLAPSVTLVEEGWPDSATRELMMRRYLNRTERAAYEALNPRAQRQHLLGRVAAKDAVRHRLWDRGGRPMFPAELTVTNHESGRPVVAVPGTGGLSISISIAHTDGAGAAIVAANSRVGIDIEAVSPRGRRFDELVLTEEESALLADLLAVDRDLWLTRVWAAKEAAAKASGGGLGGRPKDFPVQEVRGERVLIADQWVTTMTRRGSRAGPDGAPTNYVIAWTETDDG
jgi:phosphopantetheinyl transferase